MSRRNSAAAKAARRRRALEQEPGYPVMPPGFCYQASMILAACYPELRYAEGTRVTIARVASSDRERRIDLEHAWNVHRETGGIWDSTLRPEARLLMATPVIKSLEYREGIADPPAEWQESAEVIAIATQGLSWYAKRRLIEAMGRTMHERFIAEPGQAS